MIHIACCSNEKLAPIFGVVMTSVGVNVKSDNVMMHYLHNGLKDKTIKRLRQIAERYHIGLELMEINSSLLKDFPTNKNIHYADIMMYARLLLASMLPNLTKVIYLDCDIVVLKDLKELWEFDVSKTAVGMCPDLKYKDQETLERLGLTSDYYLNSGVIVMNLDYWRQHDIQNRLLTYIANKGDKLIYNDQDALNVVLRNERKILPCKFNITRFHFYKSLLHFPEEIHNEIIAARDNTVILHFMGRTKPWALGNYLVGNNLFTKYQKLSGWRYRTINKQLAKRILYTTIPYMNKNSWENKNYIEGWEKYYNNL